MACSNTPERVPCESCPDVNDIKNISEGQMSPTATKIINDNFDILRCVTEVCGKCSNLIDVLNVSAVDNNIDLQLSTNTIADTAAESDTVTLPDGSNLEDVGCFVQFYNNTGNELALSSLVGDSFVGSPSTVIPDQTAFHARLVAVNTWQVIGTGPIAGGGGGDGFTDPTVNNNWTAIQTATPTATVTEGQLDLDGSAYQTTTLTANVIFSTTGTAKPGSYYRIEVTTGGNTFTVNPAEDPGGVYTQPARTPFVVGFETQSDGSVVCMGAV